MSCQKTILNELVLDTASILNGITEIAVELEKDSGNLKSVTQENPLKMSHDECCEILQNIITAFDELGSEEKSVMESKMIAIINYCILNDFLDISFKYVNWKTVLHYAAESANIKVVKIFMEGGANVALKDYYEISLSVGNSLQNMENIKKHEHINELKFSFDNDFENLLFHAAKLGSLDIFKYLIEFKGLSPELKDQYMRTPLFLAVSGSNFKILKYLIEKQNAHFQIYDTLGYTPLHYAVRSNNLEIIIYLFKNGANLFAQSKNGVVEPILYAAQTSNLNVFKYIFEDLNRSYREYGKTSLSIAAEVGNLDIVKYLVGEQQFSFYAYRDSKRYLAPNFQAAKYGQFEVLKYFMKEVNISVYQTHPNTEQTILHEAAAGGNIDMVKYLIEENGLEIKKRDIHGSIPLFYAVRNSKLNIVKYFLEDIQMSLDFKDYKNRTILHIAASYADADIVKYLVSQKNLILNSVDVNGLTPICSAVRKNKLENVRCLSEHGYCNNENVIDSINPLHLAANEGHLDIVKYLIEVRGENIFAQDSHGRPPMFYAIKRLHVLKYFLEDKKADVNTRDDNGQTLLFGAVILNDFEAVKYLVKDQNADISIKDNNGKLPLVHAIQKNRTNIANFLQSEKRYRWLKQMGLI